MRADPWAVVGGVLGALGIGFAASTLVVACPSAPRSKTPTPTLDAPSSFEQNICNALAAEGCSWGSASGCAAALRSNVLDDAGDYLAPWAACIYTTHDAAGCSVPCGGE